MTRKSFINADDALNDLLNRFEKHDGKPKRLFAYFHADRFDNIKIIDQCSRRLRDAERFGAIELLIEDLFIKRVALKDIEAMYRFLGREPIGTKIGHLIENLRKSIEFPDIWEPIFQDISAAWLSRKQYKGIPAGKWETLSKIIVLTENIIRHDGSPVDFRTFSRDAIGDSKLLEKHESSVTSFLQNMDEKMAGNSEGPRATLARFGLEKMAPPAIISGDLVGICSSLNYFGMHPDDLVRAKLASLPTYVLFIENYVSFVRHASEVNTNKEGLLFYTGGFPSPAALSALMSVLEANGTVCPIYHWGDMDPDGIRIFQYLADQIMRRLQRPLFPHLMSKELLKERGVKDSIAKRIDTLGSVETSKLSDLAETIRASEMTCEQEAIAPQRPPIHEL